MTKLLRKLFRPWRLLIITLAAIVVLVVVDWQFRKSSYNGYSPQSTTCTIIAEDFPGFYAALPGVDAVQSFSKASGYSISDTETAVRRQIGVRPTPFRWRVWLGDLLVVGVSKEGAGICLKPGLLLRCAEFATRFTSNSQLDADGIRSFNGLFYAWRDGYLLFSQQHSYVAACLKATVKMEKQSSGNRLRIQLATSQPNVELTVAPESGLPVSGWLNARITARTAPLTLAEAWPSDPLVSVTASSWADICTVSDTLKTLLDKASVVTTMLDAGRFHAQRFFPFDKAPIAWDAGTDECSCILAGVDTSGIPPLPEVGFILRSTTAAEGAHPLEWLAQQGQSIPYEWNGRPGLMVPKMGEELSLCLSSHGSDWLATSQEPLMNAALGHLKQNTEVDADMAFRMNWTGLSKLALALANEATQFDLIPGMNPKKLETEVAPLLRAVGTLGQTSLDAQSNSNRLEFSGHLAKQAAKGSSTP